MKALRLCVVLSVPLVIWSLVFHRNPRLARARRKTGIARWPAAASQTPLHCARSTSLVSPRGDGFRSQLNLVGDSLGRLPAVTRTSGRNQIDRRCAA
jgi:hypothetical protein